jgi:hypothetical protein
MSNKLKKDKRNVFIRHPRTIGARRDAVANSDFVRSKRNKQNLPTDWWDIVVIHEKSWKKTRKQAKPWGRDPKAIRQLFKTFDSDYFRLENIEQSKLFDEIS